MAAGSIAIKDIFPDGDRTVINSDPAAASSELILRRTELSDSGTYICVTFNVDNMATPMEKKVQLEVEGTVVA